MAIEIKMTPLTTSLGRGFLQLVLLGAYIIVYVTSSSPADEFTTAYFPDVIPHFAVRRDTSSKEPVSRGRLHLVGEALENALKHTTREVDRAKIPFAEFRKHLQCSPSEPDLDGKFGTMSLFKMAPPTYHSLKILCAWIESSSDNRFKCRPYAKCADLVDEYLNRDKYPSSLDVGHEFTSHMLFRVINGTLYEDWPWGQHRIPAWIKKRFDLHYELIEMTIRAISDIGDSAFFFGNEWPYWPWNMPFPAFSMSPGLGNGNMPWPWPEMYEKEHEVNKKVRDSKTDFSDETFAKYTLQKPWANRIEKAAYFASYIDTRHIAFDQAAHRPDLIEACLSFSNGRTVQPWSLDSTEEGIVNLDKDERKSYARYFNYTSSNTHFGYVEPMFRVSSYGRAYNPGDYKYVVTLSNSDSGTSGRLAHLMAHSGAVILLQETRYSYHFQARLIPWVHYVPLNYAASDLIEKVEWLKDHDDMAQQLATNARNFGKSYLRMEDYYCYAATALQAIAMVESQTDITKEVNVSGIVSVTHHLQKNRRLQHDRSGSKHRRNSATSSSSFYSWDWKSA